MLARSPDARTGSSGRDLRGGATTPGRRSNRAATAPAAPACPVPTKVMIDAGGSGRPPLTEPSSPTHRGRERTTGCQSQPRSQSPGRSGAGARDERQGGGDQRRIAGGRPAVGQDQYVFQAHVRIDARPGPQPAPPRSARRTHATAGARRPGSAPRSPGHPRRHRPPRPGPARPRGRTGCARTPPRQPRWRGPPRSRYLRVRPPA
jgi:hypothetical protein